MERMDTKDAQTCLTCKHNTYRDLQGSEWVSCGHPVTIAKTPRPVNGDPAWVDLMTSDHRVLHLSDIPKCSAWEATP